MNDENVGALSNLEEPEELSSHEETTSGQAPGLSSIDPKVTLQMARQRMEQLTQLKEQMRVQAQARKAAMERAAQSYEQPIDNGLLDPGLIALGRGMGGAKGFLEGLQGMQEARQKLAERDWARRAAAEKLRAQSEQQGMTDLLNEGKIDQAMFSGLRAFKPTEFTNANGERVQVITNPATGEVTERVLGKVHQAAGQGGVKLRAGFQWATDKEGKPVLDDNGLPTQAKISTISPGTVPGSASSGDIPEKGWKMFTDGEKIYRGNANSSVGVQVQTQNGWEASDVSPANLKAVGGGAAGAMNQRYTNRVLGAANEGAASLATIAGMGNPSTNIFGAGKGSVLGGAMQKAAPLLSTEATKRYNATMAGLSVEIATAQNQGMVPNESQIQHISDAITILPTDDETTKKYRIALAARYLDKGLETSESLASPDQLKHIERVRKTLKSFPNPDSLLSLKPENHMFKEGNLLAEKEQEVKSTGPVKIFSDEDYDALPSGTVFVPPTGGKPRRKP